MNIKKYLTVKNIIMALTFVVILVTGIMTKQKFYLMFPLFISLFIMAFQADANRYGYLAGGLNSLLYAGAYMYQGVYFQVAFCVLFSFPIQVATFIRWKNKSYEQSTVFKKMSFAVRTKLLVAFVALYVLVCGVCMYIGYNYAILDIASFMIGIAVSVLTMLAYIEYSYMWLISAFLGLALSGQVAYNDFSQLTYFIFAIYSAYCVILAYLKVKKLYKEQSEGLKNEN